MSGAPDHLLGMPVLRAGFAVSLLSRQTGLRLSGQVDLATADLLRQAIATLPPGARDVHLQLASLEFIDVAATRELVLLGARPPCPRLILHYPPPGLLRLLQICWPEARPRIALGAARPGSSWAWRRRALSLVPPVPADRP